MPAWTRSRKKSRKCKRRSQLTKRRSRIFGRSWRRAKQRRRKRRNLVWFKNEKAETRPRPHGIDFESAAARVTAEDPEVAAAADAFVEADEEALIIKPEW